MPEDSLSRGAEATRYDVAVAYRICPVVSAAKPAIFADDKLELSALCLESFKRSLGDLRVKLFVILDSCPAQYATLFTSRWTTPDLVLGTFDRLGNGRSYLEQLRTLREQNDSELVYFAEDDYFYLPNAFADAVAFMRANPDVEFCTPYDHPDYYSLELHAGRRPTRRLGDRTWTSRLATTMTFMTRKQTLEAALPTLTSYGLGNSDVGMWMALTRRQAYSRGRLRRWTNEQPFWASSVRRAWRYCRWQLLFGRRHELWAPTPTIATHMVAGLEAPGVNWQELFHAGHTRG
jgi:hypothetical protein